MVRISLGKTPFCERPTESLYRIRSRSSRFGSVFRHHEQEVAGLAILLAEDGQGRVPTLPCQARPGDPPPLRGQQPPSRWAGGALRRGAGGRARGPPPFPLHALAPRGAPRPSGPAPPAP